MSSNERLLAVTQHQVCIIEMTNDLIQINADKSQYIASTLLHQLLDRAMAAGPDCARRLIHYGRVVDRPRLEI
jgi:hypothetical protein